MDGNIQFPASSRYFWGAPHTSGARRLGALFCRGGSQTRPPLLTHGAHPFVGADIVRPPKPPLKREVARRSRDGGFLPPPLSVAPAGDEKPPVTAFGGDSPLFKWAWTIRPAAPGPFVRAGPRPARILHPAPGHRRGEALFRRAHQGNDLCQGAAAGGRESIRF